MCRAPELLLPPKWVQEAEFLVGLLLITPSLRAGPDSRAVVGGAAPSVSSSLRQLEGHRACLCAWLLSTLSWSHLSPQPPQQSWTHSEGPPPLPPAARAGRPSRKQLRKGGPHQGSVCASHACVAGCAFQPRRCVGQALLLVALLFSGLPHSPEETTSRSWAAGPAHTGFSALGVCSRHLRGLRVSSARQCWRGAFLPKASDSGVL